MSEFKLIVAGGRDFNDYGMLSEALIELASTIYDGKGVSIVSGAASGADGLAIKFAGEHDVQLYTFPANWDEHGKGAGFIRNRTMGDFADGLLAFWDGQSKGTKHMIDYMLINLKKPVHVVRYDYAEPYIKSFN